jgi:hypothetical protein
VKSFLFHLTTRVGRQHEVIRKFDHAVTTPPLPFRLSLVVGIDRHAPSPKDHRIIAVGLTCYSHIVAGSFPMLATGLPDMLLFTLLAEKE